MLFSHNKFDDASNPDIRQVLAPLDRGGAMRTADGMTSPLPDWARAFRLSTPLAFNA